MSSRVPAQHTLGFSLCAGRLLKWAIRRNGLIYGALHSNFPFSLNRTKEDGARRSVEPVAVFLR
jgi:hypothetical protein